MTPPPPTQFFPFAQIAQIEETRKSNDGLARVPLARARLTQSDVNLLDFYSK